MVKRRLKAAVLGVAALTASFSGGCVFATDLLNPGVLLALGFDPATVIRPSGAVIVAFTNNTDRLVEFQWYQAIDPNNLSAGVVLLTSQVPPGDTSNEVIQCPTSLMSLGIVEDDFTVTPTGALIFLDDNPDGTPVTYNGSPLQEGLDYRCGDLLSVDIVVIPGGDNQFGFVIEVIPGR